MTRHYVWMALLLGLWAMGCNEPCQTYCDNVTDFYNGCVVDTADAGDNDVTWAKLGSDDANEYHAKCLDRFERTLEVVKTEDRNVIYDWCAAATLEVATASTCDSFVEPDRPDLLANEEETEDSATDDTGL